MNNVIFDFYRKGKLITIQDCSGGNFDSETNFFGPLKTLFLIDNAFYNPICPYVFMNTNIQQLLFNQIANSLIFKNRIEFLNINETNNFDMNTKNMKSLILIMYSEIRSCSRLLIIY